MAGCNSHSSMRLALTPESGGYGSQSVPAGDPGKPGVTPTVLKYPMGVGGRLGERV